ncbi:helix-turn-helix domain-containing protein [Flavitalea antarctica]
MIYPFEADIVPFIRNLVQGLQPYAEANDVSVSFDTPVTGAVVLYQPYELSQSLTYLICNIISVLPVKEQISVRLFYQRDQNFLKLEVENTGINLIRLNEMAIRNRYAFDVEPLPDGTKYSLSLSGGPQEVLIKGSAPACNPTNNLPRFYAEIQKRLRSCFTQSEKLTAALELHRPQEALFIKKINTVIKVNLADEGFDTNALCKAMSMSRTQLFRRLTSLVSQAPAGYIKSMRLNKAKELLETTDLSVSEIACRTGFQTGSNFTKVFHHKYGILPSHCRSSNRTGTNE